MIIEILRKITLHISYLEERINLILDVIVKIEVINFNVYCEKTENNDIFDALAAGIDIILED